MHICINNILYNHTFLIIMFNAIKCFFYKSISKKDFIYTVVVFLLMWLFNHKSNRSDAVLSAVPFL